MTSNIAEGNVRFQEANSAELTTAMSLTMDTPSTWAAEATAADIVAIYD